MQGIPIIPFLPLTIPLLILLGTWSTEPAGPGRGLYKGDDIRKLHQQPASALIAVSVKIKNPPPREGGFLCVLHLTWGCRVLPSLERIPVQDNEIDTAVGLTSD